MLKVVHFLNLKFTFNWAASIFICLIWQPYPSPNNTRVRGQMAIFLSPSSDSTGMKLRSGRLRNAGTPMDRVP